jgi:hypothetical protein
MHKTSLTVFLCSTYGDLSAERDGVLEAVRKLQLQHDSMEFFGARAAQPIETCLEEVRRSDVLVVIVGYKYGSLVPDRTISFTEAEYSEGYRLGKPCLVYLRDENVPILPVNMERDPQKLQSLERLKELLKARHTVATFKGAGDLAVSVTADLSRTVQAIEEGARAREENKRHPSRPIFEYVNVQIRDALERQVSEDLLLYAIDRAITDVLATEGKRLVTVFLSYSHQDGEVVRAIESGLRAEGVSVWLDQNEINVGDSIVEKISTKLATVDFLVFFISAGSISSSWAQYELNNIISRRISEQRGPKVIPVLLSDVEVPSILRDVKFIDLRDRDVQRGVKEIVKAIRFQERRSEKVGPFQI